MTVIEPTVRNYGGKHDHDLLLAGGQPFEARKVAIILAAAKRGYCLR
jgi:hypothetical protein